MPGLLQVPAETPPQRHEKPAQQQVARLAQNRPCHPPHSCTGARAAITATLLGNNPDHARKAINRITSDLGVGSSTVQRVIKESQK